MKKILLFVFLASLVSCSNQPQKVTEAQPKKIKIAIIVNAIAPFWNPMIVGMERAAKEFNVEANWKGPQNAQVAEQKRLIEEAVAQGVDGISISVIDAKAIGPVLDEVAKKGILVITIDSDAPDSARKVYIGTKNYNAGMELGKKALEIIKGKKGKVIAFVGRLEAQNAQERLQGFKDATKGVLDVETVLEDQTDKTKARRNVEDAIQAHPEVNMFVGLWSYNGPAIAAAVKEAKKHNKIKVVCFDAEPITLQYLKTGDIDVTVAQKPYQFGYLSVKILHDMLTMGVDSTLAGLPTDRIIDTGVEIVTPANLGDYIKELEQLGIKSS